MCVCVCERESGVNLSGDILMPIYEVLSVCMYMYVCMYMNVCTCMYVHVCMYVHECMYMNVCT